MSQIETLSVKNLHVNCLQPHLEVYDINQMPITLSSATTTHHIHGISSEEGRVELPHKTHGEVIYIRNDSTQLLKLNQETDSLQLEANKGCMLFGGKTIWKILLGDATIQQEEEERRR